MTEGWGVPEWLPPAVARRMEREDALEVLAAKRAGAAREARAEESHQRALMAFREAAEARGEVVDVMDLAAGRVRGRTIQDIFAEATAACDREDRREALRVLRQGTGEPARLHVDFGEPNIATPAARSERGLAMFNRYRHWKDALEARRRAEAAALAAERSKDDYGLVCAAPRREDRSAAVVAARRAGVIAAGVHGDRVSYR